MQGVFKNILFYYNFRILVTFKVFINKKNRKTVSHSILISL